MIHSTQGVTRIRKGTYTTACNVFQLLTYPLIIAYINDETPGE